MNWNVVVNRRSLAALENRWASAGCREGVSSLRVQLAVSQSGFEGGWWPALHWAGAPGAHRFIQVGSSKLTAPCAAARMASGSSPPGVAVSCRHRPPPRRGHMLPPPVFGLIFVRDTATTTYWRCWQLRSRKEIWTARRRRQHEVSSVAKVRRALTEVESSAATT